MCNNRFGRILSIILSVILGSIVGILVYIGVITEIAAIALIALVISLLILILLILVSASGECETQRCVCRIGKCLTIAVIGTIILAIAILAVLSICSELVFAILLGIGAFFFFLAIIKLTCFLLCLVNSNCRYEQ